MSITQLTSGMLQSIATTLVSHEKKNVGTEKKPRWLSKPDWLSGQSLLETPRTDRVHLSLILARHVCTEKKKDDEDDEDMLVVNASANGLSHTIQSIGCLPQVDPEKPLLLSCTNNTQHTITDILVSRGHTRVNEIFVAYANVVSQLEAIGGCKTSSARVLAWLCSPSKDGLKLERKIEEQTRAIPYTAVQGVDSFVDSLQRLASTSRVTDDEWQGFVSNISDFVGLIIDDEEVVTRIRDLATVERCQEDSVFEKVISTLAAQNEHLVPADALDNVHPVAVPVLNSLPHALVLLDEGGKPKKLVHVSKTPLTNDRRSVIAMGLGIEPDAVDTFCPESPTEESKKRKSTTTHTVAVKKTRISDGDVSKFVEKMITACS